MNGLIEFKFRDVYDLADLIDNSVKGEAYFWNYNDDFFINAACRFSKDTLLHLYIVTTALNYYRRDFRKNGSSECEETMERWYSLFECYQIKIREFNFNGRKELVEWFNSNEKKFEELFDKMADEVFYILFGNREFLLAFNNLTAETIAGTTFPKNYLTPKGTIKRTAIPKWVKTAVFHRDKGRCVFCNIDLTGLINPLANSN
jgi:hypothetical protein